MLYIGFIIKKESCTMKKIFTVLFFLLFDAFFIFAIAAYWSELGGYIFLLLAFVAFFTWQLIQSLKQLSE